MMTLASVLLGLVVFMLPFDQLPFLRDQLREMSHAGAFYPIILALIFLLVVRLKGQRLQWPKNRSVLIMAAFGIWVVLSTLANLSAIIPAEMKGRTGVERLLTQGAMVVFGLMTIGCVFNLASLAKEPFRFVKRGVVWSVVVAGFVGLLEMTLFFAGARPVYDLLDGLRSFLFHDHNSLYQRLRTVCQEASSFAIWGSFVFPWLLGGLFTRRHFLWALLGAAYFVVMMTLTFSRLAYATILLQMAMVSFLLFFSRDRIALLKKMVMVAVLFGTVSVLSLRIPLVDIYTLYSTWTSDVREVQLPILRPRDPKSSDAASVDISSGSITVRMTGTGEIIPDPVTKPVYITSIVMNMLGIFRTNTSYTLSNASRMGSLVAAFRMAKDNPLFGVGLGQYNFHMTGYVPQWALLNKTNGEFRQWMNPAPGTVWAPVHNIYARLAAETGFLGMLLWLVFWFMLFGEVFSKWRVTCSTEKGFDSTGLTLLVLIVGTLTVGATFDSFRFFGYWITAGLAWKYTSSPSDESDLS